MKSGDQVGGKAGRARPCKPEGPKRQNAPKDSGRGISLGAGEKTDPTVHLRERDEALAQLNATAEVLRVIA
jgi:hypothetical protein